MSKIEKLVLVEVMKVLMIDTLLVLAICSIPSLIACLILALIFIIFNVTVIVNCFNFTDYKPDEKKTKQYKNSGNTYRPRKHKYYFKTGHHYTKTRGIS